MILQVILLIAGFGLLIKGADWMVNGSSSLARKMNVSELVIGLTIVAFGTSAPELVVNVLSSAKGLSDMAMGNIVGSNIVNLMLILGLAGVVSPLVVQHKTTWREIPMSLAAAMILLLLANDTLFNKEHTMISRIDGIILLILFSFFMIYIARNMKNEDISGEDHPEKNEEPIRKLWFLIIIGLAGLVIGSKLVVDNATIIAQDFGISERIIGLTIVSIGTSLPELVTSVVAAFKKKTDIAVGNVIGSNIFNILLILGISSIINPIPFSITYNTDLFILAGATIFLFVAMFSGTKFKLDRWEAGFLVAGYAAYLWWLI